MFLRVAEIVFIVAAFAFIITQIVLPALTNRKLFPLFRKTEVALSNRLVEVNQKIHEAELAKVVARREATLKALLPSDPAPVQTGTEAPVSTVAPVAADQTTQPK